MVADKAQCKAVGAALVALIYAIKEQGAMGATDEAMAEFTAVLSAADDIKGDTDAAVPYVLAGAAEAYGDKKAGP
jgi:hypothetical protein